MEYYRQTGCEPQEHGDLCCERGWRGGLDEAVIAVPAMSALRRRPKPPRDRASRIGAGPLPLPTLSPVTRPLCAP